MTTRPTGCLPTPTGALPGSAAFRQESIESQRPRWAWRTALLGVFLLALLVRVSGAAWQLPWQFHPDEGHYVWKASDLVRDNQLNPKYFRNPSLFTYLLFAEQKLLALTGLLDEARWSAFDPFAPPSLQLLLGRLTSALLGAATVLVVYQLGARLISRSVGLLGALLLGLAFIHVRDSQFATNDVPATFLLTLSVLFSARLSQTGRPRDLLLAALFGGLASSTKYNAGFFVVPLLVAFLLAHRRRALAPGLLLHLVGAGALSLLAYLAGTPFTLLAWPAFVADFRTQQRFSREGWEGQGPEPVALLYLDALGQGLGWVALGLALVGLLLLLRRRPAAAAVLAAYPAVYLAYMLGVKLFFVRFAVTMVPFLCLLAAYAIWELAQRVPRAGARPLALALLTLAAVAQPVWNDLLLARILAQPDTRVLAFEWLDAHAPPEAKVVADDYTIRDRRPRPYLPDRSRFDLDVLNSVGEHDLAHYRRQGYAFVVTSSFQAHRYPTPLDTYSQLDSQTRLLATFAPTPNGSPLPFDMEDLYAPFHDLARYERPGPTVKIYALNPS